MARLVIFDATVRAVDLPERPVVLGRSQKADVPIRDSVLSRKHCTIVPTGAGFCLIDLKSSNGTYLNGSPVKTSDLHFDDIIEIGNTVIVLLDTDTMHRGEGTARLRNPAKAQELIRAIRKRTFLRRRRERRGPPARQAGARSRGGVQVRRKLRSSEAAFLDRVGSDVLSLPFVERLLENYAYHRVGSLLAQKSPELREALLKVLDRVLAAEALAGDGVDLQQAIHRAVGEVLEEMRAPASDGAAAPAAPSPAAGESGQRKTEETP
jgi:pSer/pThr/pTyr-binding forkhead associated (FHA) protein